MMWARERPGCLVFKRRISPDCSPGVATMGAPMCRSDESAFVLAGFRRQGPAACLLARCCSPGEPAAQSMSEDYKQRPDDHLVEPFFSGLGLDEGKRAEPSENSESSERPAAGWFQRLLVRLGLRRP